MGAFCEVFGHSFDRDVFDTTGKMSSDRVFMIWTWTCTRCGLQADVYEPMDACAKREGEWLERSGGSVMPPPDWLGPPKPSRFPKGRGR